MNKIITIQSSMTLGTLALLGFATTAVSAQLVTSYSGDAYVIRQDENSNARVYGDTGALPAGGGSLTGSQGSFTDTYNFTTLTGGTTATTGGGGNADSSATVTGFHFDDFVGDTISFDGATALSHADAGGVTGSVLFTNLFVDGVAYTNPVAPNTVISLNSYNGTITLNKQIDASVAGHNEITVQGVDIYAGGFFEINAGVANSDLTFTPAAATPEPGSIALLVGMTTVGASVLRRRRK